MLRLRAGGRTPGQVDAALAVAADDCVVTDVGSTKRQLLAAVDDPRFVGGHPIAGAETSGVEHARADLFQGAVWYLTPTERTGGLLYERLHRLLKQIGARPVAVDPETHDRLVAVFSHLPHVLANVLARQAAEPLLEQGEALARSGRASATPAASRAPTRHVGRRLRGQPRGRGGRGRAASPRSLDAAADLLEAATGTWPAGTTPPASDRRRLLEADQTGQPVHELRLTVPNRPGIVAPVALALGEQG